MKKKKRKTNASSFTMEGEIQVKINVLAMPMVTKD